MSHWPTLAEVVHDIQHANECGLEIAKQNIIADLANGRRDAVGIKHGINRNLWEISIATIEEIPAAYWLKVGGEFEGNLNEGQEYRGDVIVDFTENKIAVLVFEWGRYNILYSGIQVSPLDEQTKKSASRNKGGKPPTHDWDAFWCHIVKIANTPDGLPDRTELQRHMMKWCAEQWGDDAPADSTVRGKLAKLY